MTAPSLPRNALAKPRSVRAARADRKPAWAWLRRAVVAGFLIVVAVLMVRYARGIDWSGVWRSIRGLPGMAIGIAAALAATSHLLYSSFDLIGKRYTGHALPSARVVQIGLVSYAFNLNMGSTVGGIGFRLRLYTQLGLAAADIVRILTLSMVSNWLGYMLLAGLVFTFSPLDLPVGWRLEGDELSLVGLGLLAVVAGYVLLSVKARRRSWTIRGHELIVPPWRMAAAQIAISAVNWSLIAGALYVLLQGRVPYFDVLSVFLLAAMAGLIIRVPGGLGVLEAVFIALLSHRVPETELLAALLAYRAIYYFAPLAVASLLYLRLETSARGVTAPGAPPAD